MPAPAKNCILTIPHIEQDAPLRCLKQHGITPKMELHAPPWIHVAAKQTHPAQMKQSMVFYSREKYWRHSCDCSQSDDNTCLFVASVCYMSLTKHSAPRHKRIAPIPSGGDKRIWAEADYSRICLFHTGKSPAQSEESINILSQIHDAWDLVKMWEPESSHRKTYLR